MAFAVLDAGESEEDGSALLQRQARRSDADVVEAPALATGFLAQCESWNDLPGHLPVFRDSETLVADGWAPYFEHVYGEVPTTRYPICLGSFWLLDRAALAAAEVQGLNISACPHKDGDVFETMQESQPPWSLWIRHHLERHSKGGPPGIPGHTWIEVTSVASEDDDKQRGAWLMFSMGSGVWFNVGATAVFAETDAARSHFAKRREVTLAAAAAADGLDSLQFTSQRSRQWRCTDGKSMGLLILAARVAAAEGSPCGAEPERTFKAGWNADKPCICDPQKKWLGCKGFGGGGRL